MEMQNPRLRPGALSGSPGLSVLGVGHVIDIATAAELEELAERIARIRPISNSNPHAFYEERSEVASQIRRLAGRLRCPDQAAQPNTANAPTVVGRQIERRRALHIEGRTILVLDRRQVGPPRPSSPPGHIPVG